MNKRKLGRNDKCWCESELKYKKCHLNREKQTPKPLWNVDKDFQKSFSAKKCMAPPSWQDECSGEIIKAHTVPRSNSLKKIARNGHVYSFIPSLKNIAQDNGFLKPRLTGIKNASTFSGFCSKHDNSIFLPLEDLSFKATKEQCFLLAYRGLARECYTKVAASEISDIYRSADVGKPIDQQFDIQDFTSLYEIGLSAGLQDNQIHKEKHDNALVSGDYSDIRAYIIELNSPTKVMCSAGIFPEEDFKGNPLQDVGDISSKLALITLSSFSSDNKGFIVFSWLSESDPICVPFIKTLHSIEDSKLTGALLRFMFQHIENLHISPDWWDSLDDNVRKALIKRMSISAFPFEEGRQGFLLDDGVNYPNWKFSSRSTLGFSI